MAKAIVITQDDKGIELLVTFYDAYNNLYDLTGKTVNVVIWNPDNTEKFELLGVPTTNRGEASIILDERHTKDVGTYSTFWQVISSNGEITAQSGIYYTVLAKWGGATE